MSKLNINLKSHKKSKVIIINEKPNKYYVIQNKINEKKFELCIKNKRKFIEELPC